jgi:hypothetical protein
MAALLFAPHPRHSGATTPFSLHALRPSNDDPGGAEGIYRMAQVGSLLRSAPSRIRRRLALIVAIAAASLPSAGA